MIAQINSFLGINEDISTQLKVGEASAMQNYRVTQNMKLRQIEGYAALLSTQIASGKTIQGQWYGKIGSTYFHLVACNGHLYKIISGAKTDLGTLTDAPTYMFYNSAKIYIMNGTEYKSFDGTNLIDVVGYIPTCYVATPPTGGGTVSEDVNLLTGFKKQSFSGNGSATAFYLFEQSISADAVTATVSGVAKAETTDFTVDRTTGVVTFSVAPGNYPDNVIITWNKTNTANRAEIAGCRKAVIFGTRVHVWGNRNTGYQNKRWHGGTVSSVTSAEYFPATHVQNIGPNEFDITDIVTQYDRQIIFTNGNRSFYSYYLDVDGVIAFPVFELNETTGNIPFGQAQVLDNDPVSIQTDGLYRWVSVGVKDERNAQNISRRVQKTLNEFTLTNVKMYDWQSMRELWISYNETIVVYNYQIDVWYKFVLPHSVQSMIVINGSMVFGDNDGKLNKFDSSERYFGTFAIEAEWEMGFYDWGREWLRKFTNQCWISIQPEPKVNMDVYWITDRDTTEKQASLSIGYNTFDYSQIDYLDWSYNTSLTPRPKRVRTKAKKFSYWKLILRNSKLGYTSSVLNITTDARVGGTIK